MQVQRRAPFMIEKTWYESQLFPGDQLFELRSTHGLPLEIALDRIITEEGLAVHWLQFVRQARKNLWGDEQTYRVISHALADSGVDREIQRGITSGLRRYFDAINAPQAD